MSERKYLPCDWADEWCPPFYASPDDFILAEGDTLALGYKAGAAGVDDRERSVFHRVVAPGDIVNFWWHVRIGTVEVIIHKDGTFAAAATVPASVNWFWDGPDVCGDSLSEFVKQYVELCGDEIEQGGKTVEVNMTEQGDQPFRLLAGNGDRGPRFEMVSKAEACQ